MSNKVSKSVTEADGIKVPKAKKPRLIYKTTIYGDVKVRLHGDDRQHIPELYDFLSDFGEDVLQKKEEFDLQRWILVPKHRLAALRKRFTLVPLTKRFRS